MPADDDVDGGTGSVSSSSSSSASIRGRIDQAFETALTVRIESFEKLTIYQDEKGVKTAFSIFDAAPRKSS